MSAHILQWIAPLHQKFRREKCEFFFSALKPSPDDSLIDIGGSSGIGGEFQAVHSFFSEVCVANILAPSTTVSNLPNIRFEAADGCALPYPDDSFDWCFSNAVIEHVGGSARQAAFASEIQRVCRKGYFVTTPNRYFPVDPHTLLPLYQFLSPSLQRKICRLSPGYIKEYEPIDLLSARQLQSLFPHGSVKKCGLPLFPNNLIVFRRYET